MSTALLHIEKLASQEVTAPVSRNLCNSIETENFLDLVQLLRNLDHHRCQETLITQLYTEQTTTLVNEGLRFEELMEFDRN